MTREPRTARCGGSRRLVRILLAVTAVGLTVGLTAVSASAQVPFAWSAPVTIDASAGLSAVVCPATSQCVAIDAAAHGNELTFDPAAPAGAAIDSSFDPGTSPLRGTLDSLACASSTQCTALDDNGYALTFNPASPGTPTPLDLDDTDRGLALACPSTSECVAVDDEGEETTFDPSSSSSSALAEIDPSGVLKAVACPTTSQCTAVGGNGAEVTFNPASPGTPMVGDVAGPNELWAITCPSSTQCVAVGENGIEATFNPETAASTSEPGVHAGGYGGTMTGVSCPSASECIAVESGGAAVTFSPESPGTATSDGISTVAVEDSISCPASGECVAAGNPDAVGAGSVVVGFEPVPAALAQPVISGVTTEGQTLSASGGSWSNEPSAYSYQWERCEGPGLPTCNAIPGATAQTYTLTEVDIGTTLQLVETASNAGGSSTPSTSPATGQVVSDLGSPSFGIGSVSDYGVIVDVGCLGTDAQCPVTVTLTITETSERGKVIAVSAGAHARDRRHTTKRTVELGHASATLASGGGIYAIPVSLDSAGQQLVKQRHKLPVEVTVTATGFAETFTSTGPVMGTRTFRVGAQTVTFHQPKPKRK